MKAQSKKQIHFILFFLVFGWVAFFSSRAWAADPVAWLCNGKSTCTMEAEVGQVFYLNTMISLYYDSSICMSRPVSGNWKSSDSKVASINKKSLVIVKKPGKANLYVSFMGKKYTCTLNVKKKGSIVKGSYKKLAEQDAALKKYAKTKITKSNFSKIAAKYRSYEKQMKKVEKKLNAWNGTLLSKPSRIVCPVIYAPDIYLRLLEYAQKQLQKAFMVTKVVRVSKSELTFTLSKSVTAVQADMLDFCGYLKKYEANELQFEREIVDSVDEDGYPMSEHNESLSVGGYCTFKKGSSKVTVKLAGGSSQSFKNADSVTCSEDGLFRFKNTSLEIK